MVSRRSVLKGFAGAAFAQHAAPLLVGSAFAQGGMPPIIFVHGNGDHAALWHPTIWRFESNGLARDRLFAFNFTDPLARDDNGVAQPLRSSTEDQLRELSAMIADVRSGTGARQVALVASSRGGYAVRNYVLSDPAAASNVSHIVLCGVPNHGVFAWEASPGNEFNGSGPFLKRLNAGELEVVSGPAFLTLRSDGMDKYAQSDGRLLGRAGVPTGINAEGPALKGATNLVLGAVDHRETAFSPRAFRETYRFIAGREPDRLAILPEERVALSGLVTGLPGGVATNRPVKGALVEIFRVTAESGERTGEALYRRESGGDGAWGPASIEPDSALEFVLTAPDYPVTHIYRAPLPRSSKFIHLRPSRPLGKADEDAGAIAVLSRPRGYFGLPRDVVLFDGHEPQDIKAGVPTDAISTLRLPESQSRTIVGQFNSERVAGKTWPKQGGHMTILEFTD